MRGKKMLTDLKLKRYTPKDGREILCDKGGLGIRIGARKKTWVFQYSFNGKRPMMTLGEYPVMSLEEARKEAAEARLSVKRGVDPGAVKKGAKQAHKAAPTVADFIEEFYDRKLKGTRSGKERKRLLTYDVLPKLGRKKMADVTRRDITALL